MRSKIFGDLACAGVFISISYLIINLAQYEIPGQKTISSPAFCCLLAFAITVETSEAHSHSCSFFMDLEMCGNFLCPQCFVFHDNMP